MSANTLPAPPPKRPFTRTQLAHALLAALAAMATLGAEAQVQGAQAASTWPDSYTSRLQVQALIQTANAEILGSNSATLSLEKWCRDHRLAAEPKLVATQVQDVQKPPTPEQRERLQIGPDEPVRYRRVQLSCGALVLSEADNWYVPARLTPDMNRLLETTDTPFGKAVLPLKPFRRTYAAKQLWSPLPPLWEMLPEQPSFTPGKRLALPNALFEHRALVFGQDLRPIAEVVETYQKGLLLFSPPAQ